MSRYWLVKADDELDMRTLLEMWALKPAEVVEIIPEDRTKNWMETRLAARLIEDKLP